MINLNDYTVEEKDIVIFNNGKAGRVKNLTVNIIKKKPEDHERAPDYKVLYTDESNGTINDAIYYPKDSDSDSQKQIAMSRIISLLHSISPESKDKLLPEFETYKLAVDFLVKQILIAAKKGVKVNIFVNYGTKNNPQQYLRVRKFNFVENNSTDDSVTRLTQKINNNNDQWDDIMSKLEPTIFKDDSNLEETSNNEGLEDW